MIRIRSEDPEKIPLPELSDCIYYKQEKTFSEDEYNRCSSLQRAITKGRILILERQPERYASYGSPTPEKSTAEKAPTDLSKLFEYLKSLESKMDLLRTSDGSTALIDQLTQKIDALEKKLQGPVAQDDSGIKETAKKLEELLGKFSGIAGKSDAEKKELVSEIPEEIYVPNIKVEDGNSHITLKTRVIERTDDLSSASEALKKLKRRL
jgi:hypothetical protein